MATIGPIMADVGGLALSDEDRDVLRHPLIGGVILFARNYSDAEQLRALCNELLALKRPRLLLAVDHEGGRIQRFRVGFSRVPSMRSLGKLWDESSVRALHAAQAHGATIARELTAFGIDLSFAPVLDLDHGVSTVIGDRAFDEDPRRVISLARAFIAGMAEYGMSATGKHFPGHGAIAADSHLELPVDRRAMEQIESRDLVPFRALINDGIASLMMAHVRYSAVDETPASLSRKWIRNYLRRKLGYQGAVFCDDLSMKGAAVVGDAVARCEMALDAGCDMLPVCNDREAVVQVLDALPVKSRPAASRRLAAVYRREGAHG
ncbi:beta-N-acetylhexosaminidase [Algiphilus sp. W345]|uniref:Beta-hexosaminidase n=1 Tax=Banduia mediterranea TaxID=3075609 RepID=A0ABU2WIN4_9GAMM|nr:beta-N-acetylhexosaminidase [Algiphilus sp. W345]MDT0497161.1 beta-N-acetylhexosaminidase [Algiphilus sp. W345]